jgi:hypothetical protein
VVNRVGNAYLNPYQAATAASNRQAEGSVRYTPLPAANSAAPAASSAVNAAARTGQKMEIRQLDEVGWGFPVLPPADADDLEYNAYRPDCAAIIPDNVMPFHLAATGETLAGTVRQRVRQQLDQVTHQRIGLYNEQKASGKSNTEIRKALQEFDAQLPDDYKRLTGLGTKINAATRYDEHRPKVIDSSLLAS